MGNTAKWSSHLGLLMAALGFCWGAGPASAGAVPEPAAAYVGFRNNGTGVFPDCTPPTEWRECEVAWAKPKGARNEEPVIGREDRKNIVWKTTFPALGNGGVCLAKGRLFVAYDLPLTDFTRLGVQLACLDPGDGKVLWTRDVHHFDVLPAADRPEIEHRWAEERRYHAAMKDALGRLWDAAPGDKDRIVRACRDLQALGVRTRESGDLPQDGTVPDLYDYGRVRNASAEMKDRLKYLQKSGVWWPMWGPPMWGLYVGSAFPTPVSDGRSVFLATGWKVLACYDLQGNLRWKQWFSRKAGYVDHVSSPILAGGKVLVYTTSARDADGTALRAFDAATGALAWQVPKAADADSYMIGSPLALVLSPPGGAPAVEAVFLADGRVVRVTDGKVLAEAIGWCEGADNPVAHGDVVYLVNAQEGGGYGGTKRGIDQPGLAAVRLVMDSPDKVSPQTLWTLSGEGKNLARRPIYYNGLVFAEGRGELVALDARTGQVLGTLPRAKANVACWNLAIAGGYLFGADHRHGIFYVLKADKGLEVVSVSQLGCRLPDSAQVHYKPKEFWGFFGDPCPLYFSGNRIFIRSYFDLYCIGDPAQPIRLSRRHE